MPKDATLQQTGSQPTRVNVNSPERQTASPDGLPVKKASHKPSITGIILAFLALLSSGIANLFIHMKYTPSGPTTGSVDREVGHAIATGTTTVLGTIFGVPFMVGAIVLGLVAVVFIVIRLRKVKVAGAILSVVALGLAAWAVSISIGLFDLIKAQPQ